MYIQSDCFGVKRKGKEKRKIAEEKMMIAIGSDHGGFELKTKVIAHLKEQGWNARFRYLQS